MADFPSKVTTETSVPHSQGNSFQGMAARVTFRVDMSFIRSIPAILMMVESVCNKGNLISLYIMDSPFMSFRMRLKQKDVHRGKILGLLHWTLIASTLATVVPAYGWVLFVAITLWILTTTLFFVILFSVTQQLPTVPWPLTVMAYNGTATVLYITAFLTNATHVAQYQILSFYGHLAAAAFFGAVVTVAYGASAFLSYLDWKGDGGNAATNTVST